MNDREKFILRAALIYVQSNLDDVNEAFANDIDVRSFLSAIALPELTKDLSVNGDEGELIKEEEVANLMTTLQ